MKKAIIALFLLLAMMVSSLAACSPTPSNTTTSSTSSSSTTNTTTTTTTTITTENAYTVEFWVDGAFYALRDLYANKGFNLPQSPSKEGFTFGGWFWDDGTFISPLNAETLSMQTPGADLYVYAKWVANVYPSLQIPTGVVLNDNVLIWNAVDGAAQYEIQVGDLSFFTDRTTFDLLGKVTQQGRYLVYVRALSENSNTANSAWSVGVAYTVNSSENPIGTHKAFEYGVGFGYNVVNSAYYDARKTSTYSPLDLSKLAAYVGTVSYSESSANYASGETIADYMESYSMAIGSKVGASGQYKCFTAGVETNFSNSFSAKIEEHNYQSFFTYFQNVEKDAYAIKNCSEESYRNMLSNDFLRQINREVPETRNLSDQELALWLIERYGTHIVTGVSLGGRIECSYYVSSKSKALGVEVISKLEMAANAGISGMFSANASMNVETNASGSVSQSDKRVVMTVNTYGGDSALVSVMKGEFSNENYTRWAESLNENANAVRLVEGGLLALHVLIPADEKYDGLRDELFNQYLESADDAYNSVLSKYRLVVSDTRTVDLSELYSAGEGTIDVMTSDFTHALYDKETGIFTIKGALDGIAINRYVFKGLYEKQNKDGNTCKTLLKNFSIQIDAEHDIEIVLENVSLIGTSGNAVIFLNPDKTQNINVTLTVNSENILMGIDGVAPQNAIYFDDQSTLTVAGDGKLTLKGGNGADATVSGQNGTVGGDAIVTNQLVINMSGELTVIGGNGGNGKAGSNGTNGSTRTDYEEKGKVYGFLGIAHIQTIYQYFAADNGTDGKKGGNGANAGKPVNCASVISQQGTVTFIFGNGGNGGNGGRGGDGGKGANYLGIPSEINFLHAFDPGNGGNGGRGGDGGNAGRSVTVEYNFNFDNIEICAGKNGTAGKGGAGGSGGKGGDGGFTSSPTGSHNHSVENAQNGQDGQAGNDGTL